MINSLQPPIPPAGASLQIVPTAGASLQLVPNSEFSLHPHAALLRTAPPLFWRGGTGVRTPLAQACSSYPIQNSKFRIHNSKCATPFGKLSEFVKDFSVNPAGASLQLVPNSKYTIFSPSYLSHILC